MITKRNRIHSEVNATISYMLFFSLLLTLAGCTPTVQNTGLLKRNAELTTVFESAQVLPDYHYYYSGPEQEPLAILGIRNDYEFDQGLWKTIDLTEAQLQKWLDRLDNSHRSPRWRYYGSYIVDNNGDRVGIWFSFSALEHITMRVDPEKKWIKVHTPDNTIVPKIPFGGVDVGGGL